MENSKACESKRNVNVLELGECLMELNFINDNLHCVRWGLAGGECSDPKIIDNALYIVNLKLEEIIKRMEAAF